MINITLSSRICGTRLVFLEHCAILIICLNLGSLPTHNASVLTSDGVLKSTVMIESDDRHFVGWLALIFPALLATQTAAEAHRGQATQEKQCTDDHQQPARSLGAVRALGPALFPNLGRIRFRVCVLILV